ncbi:MAG: hypothetical protein NZ893_00010 [Candidatus Aenigmarchaeota archaeon]|nr:hypothetical protein [Candidatus Aenigmarchaeota archaeon]
MERGKVIATLLAVFVLVALFLASPRGKKFLEESKLKDKLSFIGNFFKNLTGKMSSVKNNKASKIEMKLNAVNPAAMNGKQLNLEDSQFSITLKPEEATLSEMSLTFKSDVTITSSNFKGKVFYSQDSLMLEGKTNDICIDNICMNKTEISFKMVGRPTKYKITNVKKDVISFNEVGGSLSWAGLKTPATLEKDKLELFDFEGIIEGRNNLVYIEGKVTYMKLNNVPIGVFS